MLGSPSVEELLSSWERFGLKKVVPLINGGTALHVYTMDNVPGTISLQVIRDGIPQLVSTVRLRTGTAAVHVLFCFLPWRHFFVFIHCDRGLDFKKMS